MSTIDYRIQNFLSDTEKIFQHFLIECGKLQTGRASSALVEHISVEAYGQRQSLKNIAGISVPDAKTIVIQPWDTSVLQATEKALSQADLGATPVSDGRVLRINLPPLTQERRERMTKIVHELAEEARISLRKARQIGHDAIKAEKDENARERLQEQLQKEVDKANAIIEDIKKKKDTELLTV